jgi:hypothetical protein
MATSSSSSKSTGASKPATARKTGTNARKPAGTNVRKAAATTARKPSSSTTSTQPKTRVEQVQELAERAVLVPVGATLIARDDLVSTVKGIRTKYRTRAAVERELKRFERRGATARTRLERELRKTRTRVERELRQRRARVERTVKQNRRRLEREVRSVRKDLEKQSEALTTRVERLWGDAQERVPSTS